MSSEESQVAFDHAVAVLGVEVERILNDPDNVDCYVFDVEPYPGFEGPWVYVDDRNARLLCRWVTEGEGCVFADEDSPDGDFGDVTLDSLDLDPEARDTVKWWAEREAKANGFQVGEPMTADEAAQDALNTVSKMMQDTARRTAADYRCVTVDDGVTEHTLRIGTRPPCARVRVRLPQADGEFGSVRGSIAIAAGAPAEDFDFLVVPTDPEELGGPGGPIEPYRGIVALEIMRCFVARAADAGGELQE